MRILDNRTKPSHPTNGLSSLPIPIPIKLLLDLLLGEPSRLGLQHIRQLLLGHADLLSDRDETVGQVEVVFSQEVVGHH